MQSEEKVYFSINVKSYCSEKDFEVYRPASLKNPKSNSVMFVMEKYANDADSLKSVDNCLVFWPLSIEVPQAFRDKHAVVTSAFPRKAYNRFFRDNGITNTPINNPFDIVNGAYICKGASIGKDCVIMPGSYISKESKLGDNVYIGSGTKLMGEVIIGNDVIIRENCVIGADGLSTERDDDGTALTMPQFGGVIIGNHVRIGSSTVIGRGAIDNTVISDGCKLDNCCFISHNVVLEQNVFVVGESIVMGSAFVGKNAYISGNATLRNKIKVEEGAFVGMGAVVTKDVDSGTIVMGNPARKKG